MLPLSIHSIPSRILRARRHRTRWPCRFPVCPLSPLRVPPRLAEEGPRAMMRFHQAVELKVTQFGTVLARGWPGRVVA